MQLANILAGEPAIAPAAAPAANAAAGEPGAASFQGAVRAVIAVGTPMAPAPLQPRQAAGAGRGFDTQAIVLAMATPTTVASTPDRPPAAAAQIDGQPPIIAPPALPGQPGQEPTAATVADATRAQAAVAAAAPLPATASPLVAARLAEVAPSSRSPDDPATPALRPDRAPPPPGADAAAPGPEFTAPGALAVIPVAALPPVAAAGPPPLADEGVTHPPIAAAASPKSPDVPALPASTRTPPRLLATTIKTALAAAPATSQPATGAPSPVFLPRPGRPAAQPATSERTASPRSRDIDQAEANDATVPAAPISFAWASAAPVAAVAPAPANPPTPRQAEPAPVATTPAGPVPAEQPTVEPAPAGPAAFAEAGATSPVVAQRGAAVTPAVPHREASTAAVIRPAITPGAVAPEPVKTASIAAALATSPQAAAHAADPFLAATAPASAAPPIAAAPTAGQALDTALQRAQPPAAPAIATPDASLAIAPGAAAVPGPAPLPVADPRVIDAVGLTPRVSVAPRPPAAGPLPSRREVTADVAAPLFQPPPAPVDSAAPAAAPPVVRLATQPPQLAHDVGLAIARQLAADGNTLHLRLEPAELGRIDVRMSFDERGTLRAVVGADSALSLDLLRRDTADLGRALTDAGVRADSQSFRFEGRSDGRGGESGQQRPAPSRFTAAADPAPLTETPDPTRFQPLRWRGQVDVLA